MSEHAPSSTTPEPSSESVYQLAYVSTETEPFSQIDLVELLAVARGANAERGVTGLLLYREGCFYQVLEGNEFAVNKTFNGIEQDPRHRDVQVLFKGESESREFPDWQMAFLNLDGIEADTLAGFSDFLSRDAQPREFLENLSRGKRLALMFRTLN